jgi:hypothetical protein
MLDIAIKVAKKIEDRVENVGLNKTEKAVLGLLIALMECSPHGLLAQPPMPHL